MMDLREYNDALRAAKRILAFVPVIDGHTPGVRISKVQAHALATAACIKAGDKLHAEWADSEHTILFVG